MKIYLFFIVFGFTFGVLSNDLPLLSFDDENRKYGYKLNNEWVIKAEYDDATEFDKSGYAFVKATNDRFILNIDGKKVLKYSKISAVNEHIAIVELGYDYFLFDLKLMKKISDNFRRIEYIGEGRFRALRETITIEEAKLFLVVLDGRNNIVNGATVTLGTGVNFYSLLDSSGKETHLDDYYIYDYHKGIAKVINKKNQESFVDGNGKLIHPFISKRNLEFNSNLCPVNKGNKWGYMNRRGKHVIPTVYDHVENFHYGLGVVTIIDKGIRKKGIVNSQGKLLVPPTANIHPTIIKPGVVYYTDRKNNVLNIVSSSGKKVSSKGARSIHEIVGNYIILSGTKKSMIDWRGRMILPPKFEQISIINNKFIFASNYQRKGSFSYINGTLYNSSLRKILTCSSISSFVNGIAVATYVRNVNGKAEYQYRLVKEDGTLLSTETFQWIYFKNRYYNQLKSKDQTSLFHNDLLPVKQNGKIGFLHKSGQFKIKPSLSGFRYINDHFFIGQTEKKQAVFTSSGTMVAIGGKITSLSENIKDHLVIQTQINNETYSSLVDKEGKVVIPFQKDDIDLPDETDLGKSKKFASWSELRVLLGRPKIINKSIEQSDGTYKECSVTPLEFKKGYSLFREGKNLGLVDINGQIVLKPEFQSLKLSNEKTGLWIFSKKEDKTMKFGLIQNGKIMSTQGFAPKFESDLILLKKGNGTFFKSEGSSNYLPVGGVQKYTHKNNVFYRIYSPGNQFSGLLNDEHKKILDMHYSDTSRSLGAIRFIGRYILASKYGLLGVYDFNGNQVLTHNLQLMNNRLLDTDTVKLVKRDERMFLLDFSKNELSFENEIFGSKTGFEDANGRKINLNNRANYPKMIGTAYIGNNKIKPTKEYDGAVRFPQAQK